MATGKRPLPGPLSIAVGEILLEALNDANRTQVSVAEQMGISEAQLSRALRGLKTLSLDEFESACDALELDAVTVLASADDRAYRNVRIIQLSPRRTVTDDHRAAASDSENTREDDREDGDFL